MEPISFHPAAEALHVCKQNGTDVRYYLFDECEIHLNRLAPGSVQEWHFHTQVDESILVTGGELLCRWQAQGRTFCRTLRAGDVVRVGSTVHTLENASPAEAQFTVFRFVPQGTDRRACFLHDKTVVAAPGAEAPVPPAEAPARPAEVFARPAEAFARPAEAFAQPAEVPARPAEVFAPAANDRRGKQPADALARRTGGDR